MRWSLLIAVFGLSITDVASFAQRPPDGQRLSAARSASQDAGFFASSGVVKFQLVQGRFCLDAPRHRKGSQNRDANGVYESITVTAERGIPSLHYVCQTPQHHLTLSVQQARDVRIESWFPALSERAVLEQPEHGPICWTHSRGDLADEYHGATLLHIRHADADNFDLHFGLLAERLLRGKSLRCLSETTKSEMLSQLGEATPEVDQVIECVNQLGSRSRARRVAAERQLLTWGTRIIPTLSRLESSDLDQEQQNRIRSILRRLRLPVNDTPATLATMLLCDRTYWEAIAGDLTKENLHLTNQHLKRTGLAVIEVTDQPEHRVAVKQKR